MRNQLRRGNRSAVDLVGFCAIHGAAVVAASMERRDAIDSAIIGEVGALLFQTSGSICVPWAEQNHD